MVVWKGEHEQVVYQPEAAGSYGTDPSGARIWLGIVQRFTPREDRTIHEIAGIGKGRDLAQLVPGAFKVNGTTEFFVQNARIFKYAYGGYGRTGSTHSITGAATIPSLTFEVSQAIAGSATSATLRKYLGVKINKATLRFAKEEPLTCTLDWIAQDKTVTPSVSRSTVSDTAEVPFMFQNGRIWVDGGSVAEILNGEISLENNLEARHYINQDGVQEKIAEPTEHIRKHSGTLTIEISGTGVSYQNYLRTGSTFTTTLQMIRTSGSDYIEMDIYGCKLTSAPIESITKGIMTQTLNFVGTTGSFFAHDTIGSDY